MTQPLRIVRLDGHISPPPIFSSNFLHSYTSYEQTSFDDALITSRIAGADVVITTRIPISASTISSSPGLKFVAVFAVGCDHVDLQACQERGIVVCNVPAASNESVAEHAIALYFALRRNIVGMNEIMVRGTEWQRTGSLAAEFGTIPGTCREEVMGIFGAGELGNRIASIGRALGMTALIAERKEVPDSAVKSGRVPFAQALSRSTLIILSLPLTPSTTSLIAAPEFSLMRQDALFINVARGGLVVETDLVAALKEKKIAGAATDVFSEEPAGLENVLVRAAGEGWARGRIILSPHLAWWARSSIQRLRSVTGENVEAWATGKPQNLVA